MKLARRLPLLPSVRGVAATRSDPPWRGVPPTDAATRGEEDAVNGGTPARRARGQIGLRRRWERSKAAEASEAVEHTSEAAEARGGSELGL